MDDVINLNTKQELVKQQACFAKLTADEQQKLAALFIETNIPAGQTIVTEGDAVDSVFIIIRGTADVRHLRVENDVIVADSIAQLSTGQAIGLNNAGFYSVSGLRTATVVALTEMVLLRLSVAEFHGFALMNSHVNEIIRQNASDALQQQDNRS